MSASVLLPHDAIENGRPTRIGAAAFALSYAALFAWMTAGGAGVFVVDESVYLAMADAMARRGDLAIQGDDAVAGAPPLTIALTEVGAGGRVYPQYPAGYALIAAPFYLAAGGVGLFLLNAIAGLVAIALVRDIAARLYRDETIALLATGLFVACSFFLTYAFAIWPHVLTLSLLLGAALCAIRGVEGGRTRHALLALSGALIAIATTVRVDSVILVAPIFIWLRLVAAPGSRAAALAFLAGGVPFLALAGWFNFLKFGDFAPISYGAPSDFETLGDYAPLATAALIAGGALFAIDARRAAPTLQRLWSRRGFSILALAAGLGALALLHRPVSAIAHHLWALLADLQAYDGDYFHDAMTRDARGFLTMYGMPKKALLQSAPYFVVVVVCAADMARGRRVSAASFCFLFAAAPIAFFALKQWHGGAALNMRFFFPAIPFLAILSAAAIAPLLRSRDGGPRRFSRALALGCLGLVALQAALIGAFPDYGVAIAIYPPLIAAALLLIATGAHLALQSPASARALLTAAGVAIGAAGASNFGDFALTKQIRDRSAATDAYFARVIPKGALVISLDEQRLSRTLAGAVSLLHPYAGDEARTAAAIAAFDRAGRCIYVRRGDIAEFAERAAGVTLVAAASAPPNGLDWFATLAPIRPGCALP